MDVLHAVWYGVSRYRGVGGLPLRTEETKNFIAEVKDICGGSVKVQYGFPQRVEITVAAPSLTDAETEELLELTAALMQNRATKRACGPSIWMRGT